jgi:hypothetical protein
VEVPILLDNNPQAKSCISPTIVVLQGPEWHIAIDFLFGRYLCLLVSKRTRQRETCLSHDRDFGQKLQDILFVSNIHDYMVVSLFPTSA